jgi:hypothetical protein
VRARRADVSMGPRVTFTVRLDGATYGIGADLGDVSGRVELSGAVSECAVLARAQLVRNGEVLAEAEVADVKASVSAFVPARAGEPAWFRFDVYDHAGLMLAVSNPIFTGPLVQPAQTTFGDLVDGL